MARSLVQQYLPFLTNVSIRDKAFVARQLATMLESGIPLAQSVSIIGVQASNDIMQETMAAIVHDLEHGLNFSTAIGKHPRLFSRVFVSAVRAGEASGRLDSVLGELASQLEKDTDATSKIKGALMYPAFIFGAMIVTVVIMMVKIVPQLESVFMENNAQLPFTTTVIMSLSRSMVAYWWIYLIAVSFTVWGLGFYLKTDSGREHWNTLKIRMPIIGTINKGNYMARFARTLSMLIASGVPIIESLKIVADSIDNDIYREGLLRVAYDVSRGVPISVPLQRDKNFPMIVSQMAIVGEQTGKMDEVFSKLAHYYEGQTEDKIKGMASLLEPAVLVVIGLGAAFVVFAIIMPLYNLTSVM
ncbi:MAG: type II secretion system F family protein [bacterium]|nr:type II secretion system F family protein [bacterium]